MPTNHPTAKQMQVLSFVREFYGHYGYMPTYRQIAAQASVTASSIRNTLLGLEARGLLTWNAGESRSIKLLENK